MPERPHYRDALARLGVLARLAAFDPHVAGTPPLGLARPGSDIDILCHAPDAAAFAAKVWREFAGLERFAMWQWRRPHRPVVAAFFAEGWVFEVFGDPRPVGEQEGWRHFLVERRLLQLGGDAFRAAVTARRAGGAKTEPAFAAALGLAGDPYGALLDLGALEDAALQALLARAGFAG